MCSFSPFPPIFVGFSTSLSVHLPNSQNQTCRTIIIRLFLYTYISSGFKYTLITVLYSLTGMTFKAKKGFYRKGRVCAKKKEEKTIQFPLQYFL